MDNTAIRKQIIKTFSLNGYSLTSDATGYLTVQLSPLDVQCRQKWMKNILAKIPQLNFDSLALGQEQLELCLKECTSQDHTKESIFTVINCFDVPIFSYDRERDKFLRVNNRDTSLNSPFPPASMKSEMYRRRYSIILQRLKRHDSFRPKAELNGAPQVVLRNAEYFLCSADSADNKDSAVMLGLLVQRGDGSFYLEDLTGAVKLDLSQCKFGDGLFTEHSFVVADGVYSDRVFYINRLGLPPAELEKQSRAYFGNANTFGGNAETILRNSLDMYGIECRAPNAQMFFMSDVWLDDIKVMTTLRSMFEKSARRPPVAFVLMGNFLCQQPDASYPGKLKKALKTLTEAISAVPSICENSYFILVPGPSDPGSPLVFPRFPIPEYLTEEIRSRVPKIIFASNPCRIQYCTKEIVVVREDLLTKLSRNNLNSATDSDISKHFALTLVSQATVLPLPQHITPVYWSYSHGLDLYPLPNLVVVGDQFTDFTVEHKECIVVNPGSFKKGGFSFYVYTLFENKIDKMDIPDDDDVIQSSLTQYSYSAS